MSKSKYNGVEPETVWNEQGIDTTRLLILADVSPRSSRNWSRDSKNMLLIISPSSNAVHQLTSFPWNPELAGQVVVSYDNVDQSHA